MEHLQGMCVSMGKLKKKIVGSNGILVLLIWKKFREVEALFRFNTNKTFSLQIVLIDSLICFAHCINFVFRLNCTFIKLFKNFLGKECFSICPLVAEHLFYLRKTNKTSGSATSGQMLKHSFPKKFLNNYKCTV